jgi:hypothetical protein
MALIPTPTSRSIQAVAVIKAIGSIVSAVAVLVLAVAVGFLVRENEHLRREQECRFDLSTDVATISDRIDAITAEIFVAAIEEDEQELDRLGASLDTHLQELNPAIDRRTEAIRICEE